MTERERMLAGELYNAGDPELCGARDRANRRAARTLAEALPRAALRTIPGAGHEVNRDAPEALGQLLTAFLRAEP